MGNKYKKKYKKMKKQRDKLLAKGNTIHRNPLEGIRLDDRHRCVEVVNKWMVW